MLCYLRARKQATCFYLFLCEREVSAVYKYIFILKSPVVLIHNRRNILSFVALKPETVHSVLARQVVFGIFFRKKPISSALNTCYGTYPLRSLIFVSSLGDFLALSWSTKVNKHSANLMLCKLCLCLKCSNYPLLSWKSNKIKSLAKLLSNQICF